MLSSIISLLCLTRLTTVVYSQSATDVSIKMCNLVNGVRSRNGGLPGLSHSGLLANIAKVHLENLVSNGYDPFSQASATCNPHSWFTNASLNIQYCCYPQADCMGSKGFLFSGGAYSGVTIENFHAERRSGGFFNPGVTDSGLTPESAVAGWEGSLDHLRAILSNQLICGGSTIEYAVGNSFTGMASLWLGNAPDTGVTPTLRPPPPPPPTPPTPQPQTPTLRPPTPPPTQPPSFPPTPPPTLRPPTPNPTFPPVTQPTKFPTRQPSPPPTSQPSPFPTALPTRQPTVQTCPPPSPPLPSPTSCPLCPTCPPPQPTPSPTPPPPPGGCGDGVQHSSSRDAVIMISSFLVGVIITTLFVIAYMKMRDVLLMRARWVIYNVHSWAYERGWISTPPSPLLPPSPSLTGAKPPLEAPGGPEEAASRTRSITVYEEPFVQHVKAMCDPDDPNDEALLQTHTAREMTKVIRARKRKARDDAAAATRTTTLPSTQRSRRITFDYPF